MIVEFTGPTSTGKTSVYRQSLALLRARKEIVFYPLELFLGRRVASMIRSERLQALVLDILSFPWFLLKLPDNGSFVRFFLQCLFRSQASLRLKTLCVRSVIRKVGIHSFLNRPANRSRTILVDEGTVHSAHNFLILGSYKADSRDVGTFCRLVPRADKLIFVQSPITEILKRAGTRHDNPRRVLAKSNPLELKQYLSDVVDLFRMIERSGFPAKRTLKFENNGEFPLSADETKRLTEFIVD